jgi:glycosyltransferase involved in cell wall biosynthesis
MPMKILFVSAYDSSDRGAYTRRLLNLKEGLQQCGVVTEILYLGDYFFRYPVLKALDIPMIREKLEGYDAIHGGSNSTCWALGLMKNLQSFTLFYDVHGSIEEILLQKGESVNGYLHYLREFVYEELSVRHSDFFITCSKPLMDRLLQRGIDQHVVKVIRNGVDTELFKPRGFSSNGKVLKNKLERILAGRVELIDSLSQDELVNQLCLSDILIIPRSRHCATQMAFPTKFAEYLATGKPVIVTDVDETANFVREFDCGFVCEPSAESIAKTIIRAKRLPSSTLLDMGKNGRLLAESQFDRRIIAKDYYEFLRKVLPNS